MGDVEGAISDFRKAVEYNANFMDAELALHEISPGSG
jgi:hypothetical protein